MLLNRRNNNGQSTIEYVVLVIAVLLALILMQKYMLRGFSGRWLSIGESLGQGRIYDPQKSVECRFASFFPDSPGQWFDQKCFEQNCRDECLLKSKSSGACNSCLSSCRGLPHCADPNP